MPSLEKNKRTYHTYLRRCEACEREEHGRCEWCHRRNVCRMQVYQSQQPATTLSDGLALDRLFWLDAAAFALRYLRRDGPAHHAARLGGID